MASVLRRPGKTGTVRWRVRWREGGGRDGQSDGETCDTLATARKFKGLVEAEGDRRPEGYPKGCRGLKLQPQTTSEHQAGVSMPRPRSTALKPPVSVADLTSRAVISVAEAGQLLGLSRSSAYQAAQRGEIPTLRIGGRILVPTAPLLEMLGLRNPRPPE